MTLALLQNTLLVGAGSTLLAATLGLAAALTLSATGPCLRRALLGGALVTLALPPFLVANTWMHYLGESGAWRGWLPLDLGSSGGVILLLGLWLWPVAALAAWGAWQRLEPAHLEAEPDLRGWALIRFLLLPLARGPMVVAGLVTLVLAANNLTVPALLQVNVYPAEVWLSFSATFWVRPDGSFDWIKAASLSWPLVLLPLLLVIGWRRRPFPWPALHGGTSAARFRKALGAAWLGIAALTTMALLLLSLALPLWQVMGNARTWTQLPAAIAAGPDAILNSAATASLVATVCVVVAVFAAMPAHRKWSAGRSNACGVVGATWGALLWLPFLVPGVLIGIALIQSLNRPRTAWFYQSMGVVLLALTIRYLAIGWGIARHAVRSADADLIDAARIEGASRWQLLRHVLWPQIAPQLAVAWCIVFLLCLWDVETIVLILPPGGETVALRVFNLLHYGHTAHVNALCLVLLGLALVPLLTVAALVKVRSWGASRRGIRAFTNAAALCAALPLLSGCSAGLAPNEAPVHSQIFDRVRVVATRGVAPGQVNKPRSVAVDPADNLYVLDFTGRVQKFSPAGEFLLFWQMPETKQGNPKGLSVDPDGNIVVVEPHYARVNLYTPEGQLLMRWGEHGTNTGQFSFPRAAAVNSKGEWFVSEYGVVDRVQKFAFEPGAPSTLRFLACFGRAGSAPGEWNRAEGLCVDAQDRLLVADAVNHRIQILDASGTVLGGYGSAGVGAGELSYPYDVCVDEAGRHYVCEFGNSRIQIFDSNGAPLEILGGPGAAPGFFNNSWGIAVDSHGNLYVADSQNHRVQKFLRKAEGRVQKGQADRSGGAAVAHGAPSATACLSSIRNPPS
ncbi:MAG: ABC transporter permease subunit [Verrucomicrobia bacterium]|jgi:ABC-type Fe3+ transport system permease subunit/DNA-binding beta-propeller fold protein YncE|nr:ABC transporter permease subunit [Verrucomicrobiota bacterium]